MITPALFINSLTAGHGFLLREIGRFIVHQTVVLISLITTALYSDNDGQKNCSKLNLRIAVALSLTFYILSQSLTQPFAVHC